MPIATGVNKQVIYKKETTWGTLAGATGAKVLRRVTSNFNLEKETYQSNEIRTDYQVQDMRHGVRSVTGSVSGELSPGTYADFFASALAREFTAGVSATGITYTVAAAGNFWTVTRSAGSFITDGFNVGNVVRITAAGGNVTNTGRNLLVLAETATALTVTPLNGGTMAAESAIASATITVFGKVTYAPITGHTDNAFTFEEKYTDIPQSEVTVGNKVNTVSVSLPASGLVTCEFGFMGKDLAQAGATPYFTAPTAQGTTGVFAAVNGVLVIDGAPVALLTDLSFNINRNLENATVVGSNSIADMFEGRIAIDGSFSAYFDGGSLRDRFVNETEAALIVAVSTSNDKAADFVSFTLPRIKINSATKDDGEKGIAAQHSFTALLNSAGGAGTSSEKTTLLLQDSAA